MELEKLPLKVRINMPKKLGKKLKINKHARISRKDWKSAQFSLYIGYVEMIPPLWQKTKKN